MEPADNASPALRKTIGVILAALGIVLLAYALGIISSNPGALEGSRGVVVAMGFLLTTAGVSIGQWVAAGSRLSDALGATLVSSFAAIFGWVAFFGDDKGFSTSVGAGGAHVTTHGSASAARIAFGIAALLVAFIALWAWKRVFFRRG
jgi:uncharacterized membrane protein